MAELAGGRSATAARLIGAILIAASVAILLGIRFYNSSQRQTPIVFSDNRMLRELWQRYAFEYLEPSSGRTLDKQRDNITTSEGQAYTMLRAVWVDDKATFDRSWNWTKDNLDRPDDALSAWLFGERADGSYGIVTERGGQNSASDGDIDLAVALLFAGERWNHLEYISEARAIITDIWDKDVVTVAGKPVLASNDLERYNPDNAVLNPSYFSPYAFKLFAKVDTRHDWVGLTDSMYELTGKLAKAPLGDTASVGLVPDWVVINKTTGELAPSADPSLSTSTGYDAMRLPWRLALDWQWNRDSRAESLLKGMTFINESYAKTGALASVYGRDGSAQAAESPAMYGTSMGALIVSDSATAKKVYEQKLLPLYSPNTQNWTTKLSYYDDNWAWFGIALYNGSLPNLAANL